ncbi:hypothetical protein EYV94_18915 [Puteibacter caeruleilacunae]|nr:hypothetical protein EYV94_18915 [Puteibacter caeruleilacunae]
MSYLSLMHSSYKIILTMIRYNLKIIFGNKFIWFLLVAIGFFIFLSVRGVLDGDTINDRFVYDILLYPGLLLIFYPTVFGIQNDEDARILEILFGIPDYRYKIWLVRIVMIFIQVFLILVIMAFLASILLIDISILEMAAQVMFPILAIGSMAFMFSTIVKNGNGTAVVVVIVGILLMIFSGMVQNTLWAIFLNPYKVPNNMNEIIWRGVVVDNRLFLSVCAIVFTLYALFNLQKREKFI